MRLPQGVAPVEGLRETHRKATCRFLVIFAFPAPGARNRRVFMAGLFGLFTLTMTPQAHLAKLEAPFSP